MNDFHVELVPAIREDDVEFRSADGIFVKVIRFDPIRPSLGIQHKHEFSHVSVVLGPFMVWTGDENGVAEGSPVTLIGDVGQPCSIEIPANTYHRFGSLRGGGMLMCISKDG